MNKEAVEEVAALVVVIVVVVTGVVTVSIGSDARETLNCYFKR